MGQGGRFAGPWGVLALLTLGLTACVSAADRTAELRTKAAERGFVGQVLPAEQFDLQTFLRTRTGAGTVLRVYIEGDGFAWVRRTEPSVDPTPRDALVFRLAASDPAPAVAYLGRPCQYTGGIRARGCDVRFWTSHRLSEMVVAAVDDALDQIKRQSGATQLELVGYSGGGGLAVLVAARRQDVAAIHTLAGNLDINEFARLHQVTPMIGSMNPADVATSVAEIPQWHAFGSTDTIVPGAVVHAYARRIKSTKCLKINEIQNATHVRGWEAAWATHLADEPLMCSTE